MPIKTQEPATLDTMFSPPAVNPYYGKGWFVNKYGDYSHGGGFPGLQSLVVRTHEGFCGSVIVNTWSYKEIRERLDPEPRLGHRLMSSGIILTKLI